MKELRIGLALSFVFYLQVITGILLLFIVSSVVAVVNSIDHSFAPHCHS